MAAAIFVILDAVDVAFTEAAVGAGISTILGLGTIALTTGEEKKPSHTKILPLVVVCLTGAALVYGTLDLAHYGDPNAPAQQHVGPDYLKEAPIKTGIPNVVTAILASYRGYDTLGEVTVIFTATGIIAASLVTISCNLDSDEVFFKRLYSKPIPGQSSAI